MKEQRWSHHHHGNETNVFSPNHSKHSLLDEIISACERIAWPLSWVELTDASDEVSAFTVILRHHFSVFPFLGQVNIAAIDLSDCKYWDSIGAGHPRTKH
jgi:hypothetical protein